MQRVTLIFFAGLFALLFVGVALAVGVGSSTRELPPGVVAIVEDVPSNLGTITKAEFNQQMTQQAALAGLPKPPEQGSPEYEQMKDEALGNLIITIWLRGQGEELGVDVSHKQIASRLEETEEAKALKRQRFTQKTIEERVAREVVSEGIMEKLGERASKPSAAEIRGYYEENPEGKSFAEAKPEVTTLLEQEKEQEVFSEVDVEFPGEWQPRTHCAEGFVVSECTGYPAFAHSPGLSGCYEADPKEPVTECPAPVAERAFAAPGSVRPWRPQGEAYVQGPVPEGGGEAEASSE